MSGPEVVDSGPPSTVLRPPATAAPKTAEPPGDLLAPQTRNAAGNRPSQPPSVPAPQGRTALEILTEVAGKTAFPAVLVLIVVIFLAVQDRIDRSDPKLALAPIRSEPLDFLDPSTVNLEQP